MLKVDGEKTKGEDKLDLNFSVNQLKTCGFELEISKSIHGKWR